MGWKENDNQFEGYIRKASAKSVEVFNKIPTTFHHKE